MAWKGAESGKADTVRTENHRDHSILHPPQTLKNKAYVPMRSGDPTPDESVAEAERALEEIAVNFANWMSSEADRLATARNKFRLEGGALEQINEELFQAAHTVRGNAGVFGFPLAGRVADSLAKLIDRCPAEKLPNQLIDQHVDAIRAMLREDARGPGNNSARALVSALINVTSEFLEAVAPEPKADAAG